MTIDGFNLNTEAKWFAYCALLRYQEAPSEERLVALMEAAVKCGWVTTYTLAPGLTYEQRQAAKPGDEEQA